MACLKTPDRWLPYGDRTWPHPGGAGVSSVLLPVVRILETVGDLIPSGRGSVVFALAVARPVPTRIDHPLFEPTCEIAGLDKPSVFCWPRLVRIARPTPRGCGSPPRPTCRHIGPSIRYGRTAIPVLPAQSEFSDHQLTQECTHPYGADNWNSHTELGISGPGRICMNRSGTESASATRPNRARLAAKSSAPTT